MMYTDNFTMLGVDPVEVERESAHMASILRGAGSVTHDREALTSCGEVLGLLVDGERGDVRVGDRRFWRLAEAMRYVLRRPYMTGREVERLLGHWTHALMPRREMLSIFGTAYSFVGRSYERRQRLRASARREFRWALALLPLAFADLRMEYGDRIWAVDAPLWVLVLTERGHPVTEADELARQRERCRFRDPEVEAHGSRQRALSALRAASTRDVALPPEDQDAGFWLSTPPAHYQGGPGASRSLPLRRSPDSGETAGGAVELAAMPPPEEEVGRVREEPAGGARGADPPVLKEVPAASVVRSDWRVIAARR